MKADENPTLSSYWQTIPIKIKLLETLIDDLKKNYSLKTLTSLQKALHRLAINSKAFGYEETSRLCHDLDLDLAIKINNFSLSSQDPAWLKNLDVFLKKVKTSFKVPTETAEMVKDQKKKVVVVDDDEDLLNLLNYEFHEVGFNVQSFTTGKEAISFLSKKDNLNDVFLLVLDRMLPDMDGLDILRKLLEGPSPIKIPVLILSALSTEKDIIEGLQTGAIDYITKPFSVYMLMQKTLNLLKSQTK